MTLPTPEKDDLKACMDFLDMKRILFVRVHPVKPVSRQGQTFFTPVRPSQKGVADLLIFPRPGVVIAAECKSDRGKLSPSQEGWKERALCAGAIYITVHSVEDLQMVIP